MDTLDKSTRDTMTSISVHSKHLENFLREYINFLSCKSNKCLKDNKNSNLSDEEIKEKSEEYNLLFGHKLDQFRKYLGAIIEYFMSKNLPINNTSNEFLNNYYENLKSLKLLAFKNNYKMNFQFRFFKVSIIYQIDNYLRESFKNQRNIIAQALNKNKKLRQNSPDDKPLAKKVLEYINSFYKDSNITFKCAIPEQLNKNKNINIPKMQNIYLCFINPLFELFFFLPYKTEVKINYFERINFRIKSQHQNDLHLHNYLLFKKLNIFFQNRIKYIFFYVSEETKKKNKISNSQYQVKIDDEFLFEFAKKFICYINGYKDLFRLKCNICKNIAKYSTTDKCFYPPYYKLFNERDVFSPNSKSMDEKLFYHEECFRLMANKAI